MRVVVLTGSGVSAESGVATFRDPDGIWARHDWREVATPEAFAAEPARVHGFYNARRRKLKDVAPNPAHFALASLERELESLGGALLVVTQNVDDLHERAGSSRLVHMHGELLKARCGQCDDSVSWTEDLDTDVACAACGMVGSMRPDVVWFGETPKHMNLIAEAIRRADCFAAIGTSGSVYPAASFVAEARARGIPCTEINLEPSDNAALFSDQMYGKASELAPRWSQRLVETARAAAGRG
jgi:NAD-dependent deacetylase